MNRTESESLPEDGSGLTSAAGSQVHAVVVTYQPEGGALDALLRALVPQVECIHVIDNSPARDVRVESILASQGSAKVGLHRLGGNRGIAVALNVGIVQARECGATHVLLSDQDSLPSPDMVRGLLQACTGLHDSGCRVGAVGPTFTDRHTGITFPFQAEVPGRFFYGHARADAQTPNVEALTLITSGMLIPVEALDDVGPMREDLFIDQVDIEWCHRARARGWHLYGTGLATMSHSMGDEGLRVWYFGWRRETAYPPLRLYYRVRNFIALCKMREIAWRWKLRNAWYTLGVVYSQVCFGARRREGLAMAFRGARDGLRGRMGPYASA